MDFAKFSVSLIKELTEMKKLGMVVPEKAFTLAKDLEYIQDYDNMSVSECADLLIQLAQIE